MSSATVIPCNTTGRPSIIFNMCGIAGFIGQNNSAHGDVIKRAVAGLKHRGPDGSAVKTYDGAVLGFSRLSIIDLSSNGMQPMESADGRYSIVFNGEIYNYLELRQELSPFYKFKSQTDTEVLLNGYTHWGIKVLEKINGMFAFCIFDNLEKTAFLARDRFGQKPLFSMRCNNI